MPAICVCDKCGSAAEGVSRDDAEMGLFPDFDCVPCGGYFWTMLDVDWSELDGFDDDDDDLDDDEDDDDDDRWERW